VVVTDQFEDLKRLSDMLANGEVTQEEYDRLKADLMAEPAEKVSRASETVVSQPADTVAPKTRRT
jgi:hypothetical protein